MNTEKSLILVVDDEPDIRELIKDILEDEAYRVVMASNGEEARLVFTQNQPQVVLLDIWMPDVDGISLLKEFKQQNSGVTIVMMSGHGTIETAVEATRSGASDFIEKPLSMAKLLRTVELAIENRTKQSAQHHDLALEPVGKSAKMTQLREQAERVAGHEMPILLIGEGGTGKRYFAYYLHRLGLYNSSKFIEVSPESFPLDSYKLISLAQNNTLYINDVALLSDEAQTLLQHLLESGRLKNCQLICATQLGLDKAIARGDFSEGLFYQLNTITLQLPALREHVEDIPELVHFFVDQQTTQTDLPYRRFTVAAQNRLRNYAWPGNVLELKNVIQRLLVLGDSDDIDVDDVETALQAEQPPQADDVTGINLDQPLREAREQFERIYLLQKLQETDGNVGRAAKLAGMERTHLYRKLRALGIDSKQI